MTLQALCKVHVNGYALIHVRGAQWTVCTGTSRLGVFSTREEASAYAFALPQRRIKSLSQAGSD